MTQHGMIEEKQFSTHDQYRETAIWSKSFGDLNDKETSASRIGLIISLPGASSAKRRLTTVRSRWSIHQRCRC